VDHHGDLVLEQPERLGDRLVEDLGDVLQLGEVVAGAERAELRLAALLGAIGDEVGIGAGDAAALLDGLEILLAPEAPRDRPAGAALEHVL
jgi:hypothetical protein